MSNESTASSLSKAENEALIRRWFEEVWNKRRADAVDEMLATTAIAHGMGPNGTNLYGREQFKQAHSLFIGAFPDLQITVDPVVACDDMIGVHFICRGTHAGNHLGLPATGKPVVFAGMTIARIKGGMIVEGWNALDLLSMLQQVGAVPSLTASLP